MTEVYGNNVEPSQVISINSMWFFPSMDWTLLSLLPCRETRPYSCFHCFKMGFLRLLMIDNSLSSRSMSAMLTLRCFAVWSKTSLCMWTSQNEQWKLLMSTFLLKLKLKLRDEGWGISLQWRLWAHESNAAHLHGRAEEPLVYNRS